MQLLLRDRDLSLPAREGRKRPKPEAVAACGEAAGHLAHEVVKAFWRDDGVAEPIADRLPRLLDRRHHPVRAALDRNQFPTAVPGPSPPRDANPVAKQAGWAAARIVRPEWKRHTNPQPGPRKREP